MHKRLHAFIKMAPGDMDTQPDVAHSVETSPGSTSIRGHALGDHPTLPLLGQYDSAMKSRETNLVKARLMLDQTMTKVRAMELKKEKAAQAQADKEASAAAARQAELDKKVSNLWPLMQEALDCSSDDATRHGRVIYLALNDPDRRKPGADDVLVFEVPPIAVSCGFDQTIMEVAASSGKASCVKRDLPPIRDAFTDTRLSHTHGKHEHVLVWLNQQALQTQARQQQQRQDLMRQGAFQRCLATPGPVRNCYKQQWSTTTSLPWNGRVTWASS